MQLKILIPVAVLTFVILNFAMTSYRRSVAFDRSIAAERLAGNDEQPAARKSLPFFTRGNLTPTWDENEAIVRVPDFALTDQDGRSRTAGLFDNHYSFVAFFFTACTGICPTLIQNLKAVEKEVESYGDFQFVALSVDPQHDSAAALKKYAALHHLGKDSRWSFLTGPRDIIYSLAGDTFAAENFKKPASDDIVHTEHFYLIDPQRRLRGILNGTRLDVANDAKALVKDIEIRDHFDNNVARS